MLVILGVLFIALPRAVLDIVMTVIGGVVILYSVLSLIACGRMRKDTAPIFLFGLTKELISNIALLVFGIGLVMVRSAFANTVASIIGISMIVYAAVRLTLPSHTQRERNTKWYVDTSLLFLILAGGLFLLTFPFYPTVLAGCGLIAVGARMLWDRPWRELGKDNAGTDYGEANGSKDKGRRQTNGKAHTRDDKGGDIYTDDFVDKS
ncbi:MAG: DUF308 domain-containing protein [Clostridia bacterium]|nr:DUF308 domain-containing protein [Clostridia bacterium]